MQKARISKENSIDNFPESQINDTKVSATSAMYPVSDWQKFNRSCTNRRQVERVSWRLVPWWAREGNWTRIQGPRTSFVQRLLVPFDKQQVSKPQVLMHTQQNCPKQERQYWTECTKYVAIWHKEWRYPRSSMHFSRKMILKFKQCANYRIIALFHMQARFFFGSQKGSG